MDINEIISYLENYFGEYAEFMFDSANDDVVIVSDSYGFTLRLPIASNERVIIDYATVDYGYYKLELNGNAYDVNNNIRKLTESTEMVNEIIDEYIYQMKVNYEDD